MFSTSARTAKNWSAWSRPKGSGGRILSTLPCGPVALIRTRRSRIPLTIVDASAPDGSKNQIQGLIDRLEKKQDIPRPRLGPRG